jgi:hypothetical protein
VDLIWTAFYFIAIYFLFRFCDSRDSDQASLMDLAISALAMGLVLGTKSLGLVFVPPLLLPVAWKIWTHRPASPSGTTRSFRWRALSVLLSGLALPSAYWFARTAWLTGNPFYPLDVALGGLRVFVGMYDSTAMRRTAYHVPVTEWSLLVARLRYVVGPFPIGLWAVSLLAGLVTNGGCDGKSSSRAIRLLKLLALAHVGIYWLVLPYNTQERFLMAALGIGLVPIAQTVTRWPGLFWPLALLVLGHLALALAAGPTVMDHSSFRVLRGESLSELRWWAAGACGLLSLATVTERGHRPMTNARLSILVPVGAVVVACWCLYAGSVERLAHLKLRDAFFPETGFGARMLSAWRLVEQSTTSKPARIAYTGGNLPYYLLGSQLRNEVRYINVNAHRTWLPHDYHLARHNSGLIDKAEIPWPQWDREQTDYTAWLDNLRAAEIDLLFVSRVNLHGRIVELHGELPPFPIERRWADHHPEDFEDLGPQETAGQIPWARVYRVRARASSGGAEPE